MAYNYDSSGGRAVVSLILYRAYPGYYYALEVGMPERPVRFGEGDTPRDAVENLEGTPYQGADFRCEGPPPRKLPDYFDLGDEDDYEIMACTEEDLEEAAGVYARDQVECGTGCGE